MGDRIVFADGTLFQQPETAQAPIQQTKRDRVWRRFAVIADIQAVKEKFTDNAHYTHEWDSLVDDNTTQVESEDLSAYSVAGEIVDMRNGICWVYMGQPTELELTQAALDELVLYHLGGMEDVGL